LREALVHDVVRMPAAARENPEVADVVDWYTE
jgi:hypothetical protein